MYFLLLRVAAKVAVAQTGLVGGTLRLTDALLKKRLDFLMMTEPGWH
jgi:hypothetical protein